MRTRPPPRFVSSALMLVALVALTASANGAAAGQVDAAKVDGLLAEMNTQTATNRLVERLSGCPVRYVATGEGEL